VRSWVRKALEWILPEILELDDMGKLTQADTPYVPCYHPKAKTLYLLMPLRRTPHGTVRFNSCPVCGRGYYGI
jgi:hypothetical protein